MFIAGGFGVKNNKKTRKFLKMWANLEIGHPQGKDMKEQVLKSVSGSPQEFLRKPSAQGALSSGSPQEFLRKPSGIPQEIPVGKALSSQLWLMMENLSFIFLQYSRIS